MDLGAVWSDRDILHFWILVCLGEPTKRVPKVLEYSATCPADRLYIRARRSHVFYFVEFYLPRASQSHADRHGCTRLFQRIFCHLVHHEYSFRENLKRKKYREINDDKLSCESEIVLTLLFFFS